MACSVDTLGMLFFFGIIFIVWGLFNGSFGGIFLGMSLIILSIYLFYRHFKEVKRLRQFV